MTTPTQMHAADIDIAYIVKEVKKHGFYFLYCHDLVPCAFNHDELILMINKIASNAELKVSFNAAESVCIFSAD